jgi:hypothetical protein
MTRRPRLKVLVPILIVALLALFAAVGAVSTWRSDRSADSASRDTIGAAAKAGAGAAQTAPELAAPDQSTASSDGAYTALPGAVPSGSHYLIRNGSLSLVVRDGTLMTTVQRITAMTQGMGGYVMASAMGTAPSYPGPVEPLAYDGEKAQSGGDSVAVAQSSGDGYASLTLRVPQSSFDDALRRFSALGRVEDISTSSEDVTGQYVDLQARLRHFRAVERRLVRFLAATDNVKDMLAVQDRLDQVQLTIEQLTAQLKSLRETTSYGTLSVSLRETGATHVAAAGPGSTFGGTLWHSLQLLGRGARLCLLAVAAVLPFALVAAAVAALAWYVRRVIRGRRSSSPPAQPA